MSNGNASYENMWKGMFLMFSSDSIQPKKETWTWRWISRNYIVILQLYCYKVNTLKWELSEGKKGIAKRTKTEHLSGVR